MREGLEEQTRRRGESRGRESAAPEGVPGSGTSIRDGGQVLAELAELDDLLGQCETGWQEIARHLDGLRRQIALAGAQMQRSRSLAAHHKPENEAPEEPAPLPRDDAQEVRPQRLVEEYEASLREGHARRDALRAEMAALRRRRKAAVQSLPLPLARAYESLVDTGVLPAIAVVANGACSGCGSDMPAAPDLALVEGAAAVCPACDRLLRLESPPATGQ